jgi:hypothetical protein
MTRKAAFLHGLPYDDTFYLAIRQASPAQAWFAAARTRACPGFSAMPAHGAAATCMKRLLPTFSSFQGT